MYAATLSPPEKINIPARVARSKVAHKVMMAVSVVLFITTCSTRREESQPVCWGPSESPESGLLETIYGLSGAIESTTTRPDHTLTKRLAALELAGLGS